MRAIRTLLWAGVAVTTLACGAALAKDAFHTMTVNLPDGGTAEIRYLGNAAPKVSFESAPFQASFSDPWASFTALDRVAANMDRQMDALMSNAQAFASAHGGSLFTADMKNMPAGTRGYSMVSTFTGQGFCMRSTEVINDGKDKPKVLTRISGDCSAANAKNGSALVPTGGAKSAVPHAATQGT